MQLTFIVFCFLSCLSILSHFLCAVQCVVRVCCIRSFGHFLTNLQGNVLHFNPEAGIFTSISQSEQENLIQQAKAQFRMVKYMIFNCNEKNNKPNYLWSNNSFALICTRNSFLLKTVSQLISFAYSDSFSDFNSCST